MRDIDPVQFQVMVRGSSSPLEIFLCCALSLKSLRLAFIIGEWAACCATKLLSKWHSEAPSHSCPCFRDLFYITLGKLIKAGFFGGFHVFRTGRSHPLGFFKSCCIKTAKFSMNICEWFHDFVAIGWVGDRTLGSLERE